MIVALFILRVASLGSCLVLYECATPDITSTLVNCNEAGSPFPHRSRISRSSRLKNPGERNDVLEFSIRVLNVQASARGPIESYCCAQVAPLTTFPR